LEEKSMGKVLFFDGLSWDNLPGSETRKVIPVNSLVDSMVEFREGWQEAAQAEGKSLAEYQANVGLVILDVCEMLELSPEDTLKVTGPEVMEVFGGSIHD
jgi:hypothetical protein